MPQCDINWICPAKYSVSFRARLEGNIPYRTCQHAAIMHGNVAMLLGPDLFQILLQTFDSISLIWLLGAGKSFHALSSPKSASRSSPAFSFRASL